MPELVFCWSKKEIFDFKQIFGFRILNKGFYFMNPNYWVIRFKNQQEIRNKNSEV
jgi:hypothetical protein